MAACDSTTPARILSRVGREKALRSQANIPPPYKWTFLTLFWAMLQLTEGPECPIPVPVIA